MSQNNNQFKSFCWLCLFTSGKTVWIEQEQELEILWAGTCNIAKIFLRTLFVDSDPPPPPVTDPDPYSLVLTAFNTITKPSSPPNLESALPSATESSTTWPTDQWQIFVYNNPQHGCLQGCILSLLHQTTVPKNKRWGKTDSNSSVAIKGRPGYLNCLFWLKQKFPLIFLLLSLASYTSYCWNKCPVKIAWFLEHILQRLSSGNMIFLDF